jgi:hypothetical protein
LVVVPEAFQIQTGRRRVLLRDREEPLEVAVEQVVALQINLLVGVVLLEEALQEGLKVVPELGMLPLVMATEVLDQEDPLHKVGELLPAALVLLV